MADYDGKLENVKSMSKGVYANETWTGIILKPKSGRPDKLWSEMSEKEHDIFMFVVGSRTLNSILKIEEFWQDELKMFDSLDHKIVPSSESRPATKKEVKDYLELLQSIRKVFTSEFETYNESFFNKYKSEISDEEIVYYRKKAKTNK